MDTGFIVNSLSNSLNPTLTSLSHSKNVYESQCHSQSNPDLQSGSGPYLCSIRVFMILLL